MRAEELLRWAQCGLGWVEACEAGCDPILWQDRPTTPYCVTGISVPASEFACALAEALGLTLRLPIPVDELPLWVARFNHGMRTMSVMIITYAICEEDI